MNGLLSGAVALVNSGEALPLAAWSEIARACQLVLERAGVRDRAVESAGGLSRLFAAGLPGGAVGHPLAVEVSRAGAVDTDRLRGLLAMATHAARRGRLPVLAETMLAGVEAQALELRTAATPVSMALVGWPSGLAAVRGMGSFHPAIALAVAQVQGEVLRRAGLLLDRTVADPVSAFDPDRLRVRLDGSLRAWRVVRDMLHRQPVPEMSADQIRMMRAVSSIAVELRDALRSQGSASPAQQLDTLVRGELAGNLRVAAMVAAGFRNEEAGRALLAEAGRLQRFLVSAIGNSRGLLVADRPAAAKAIAGAVPWGSDHRRSAAEPACRPLLLTDPVRSGLPVARIEGTEGGGRLTPGQAVELARRRDAGVVAAAAVDGVVEAAAVVGQTSKRQLRFLVWDGRQACGELMATGQAIAEWRLGRYDLRDRRDCLAEVTVAIAAAAHVWDPARAGWTHYAVKTTEWAVSGYFRDEKRWSRLLRLETEPGIALGFLADTRPTPDEVAASDLDAAKVAYLVSRLAFPRDVIVGRILGLDGSEPASASAVARQLDMPASTVGYHARRGLASIRARLGVNYDF